MRNFGKDLRTIQREYGTNPEGKRKQTGTNLRAIREQSGSNPGAKRKQTGRNLGAIREQSGRNPEAIGEQSGNNPGAIWELTVNPCNHQFQCPSTYENVRVCLFHNSANVQDVFVLLPELFQDYGPECPKSFLLPSDGANKRKHCLNMLLRRLVSFVRTLGPISALLHGMQCPSTQISHTLFLRLPLLDCRVTEACSVPIARARALDVRSLIATGMACIVEMHMQLLPTL